MDYELAKSLMDAEFPQIGKGSLIGSLDKLVWRSGDRVYVPTLEELIEACGENFVSLHKQHDGWLAYANYDQSCFGKTATEAVAPLVAHASKTMIATLTFQICIDVCLRIHERLYPMASWSKSRQLRKRGAMAWRDGGRHRNEVERLPKDR